MARQLLGLREQQTMKLIRFFTFATFAALALPVLQASAQDLSPREKGVFDKTFKLPDIEKLN